jgi:hypothetical protein
MSPVRSGVTSQGEQNRKDPGETVTYVSDPEWYSWVDSNHRHPDP